MPVGETAVIRIISTTAGVVTFWSSAKGCRSLHPASSP